MAMDNRLALGSTRLHKIPSVAKDQDVKTPTRQRGHAAIVKGDNDG